MMVSGTWLPKVLFICLFIFPTENLLWFLAIAGRHCVSPMCLESWRTFIFCLFHSNSHRSQSNLFSQELTFVLFKLWTGLLLGDVKTPARRCLLVTKGFDVKCISIFVLFFFFFDHFVVQDQVRTLTLCASPRQKILINTLEFPVGWKFWFFFLLQLFLASPHQPDCHCAASQQQDRQKTRCATWLSRKESLRLVSDIRRRPHVMFQRDGEISELTGVVIFRISGKEISGVHRGDQEVVLHEGRGAVKQYSSQAPFLL